MNFQSFRDRRDITLQQFIEQSGFELNAWSAWVLVLLGRGGTPSSPRPEGADGHPTRVRLAGRGDATAGRGLDLVDFFEIIAEFDGLGHRDAALADAAREGGLSF